MPSGPQNPSFYYGSPIYHEGVEFDKDVSIYLRYLGGGSLEIIGKVTYPTTITPSPNTVTISSSNAMFAPQTVTPDSNGVYVVTVTVTGPTTVVAVANGVAAPTVVDCTAPTLAEVAAINAYQTLYKSTANFTVITSLSIFNVGKDRFVWKVQGLTAGFVVGLLTTDVEFSNRPASKIEHGTTLSVPSFDPIQDANNNIAWVIFSDIVLTDHDAEAFSLITVTDDLGTTLGATFNINNAGRQIQSLVFS